MYLYLLTGMLVLFLLAGGVVAFFMTYQRRLLRQQLRVLEIETAHKETLLHSNIEQVENERRRIAKDLHDEVGSIFSTLRLKIKQLEQAGDHQDSKIFTESLEVIDAGIGSVRRISHDILPPGLELFGLEAALEDLCVKASSASVLEAQCVTQGEFPRLDAKTELGLYRIAQELMNNTIRHAQASKIDISLSQLSPNITFTYTDNGKGFDPFMMSKSGKGLGMNNIEARASQIKGKLEWIAQPGEGMKTIITIPLFS